MHHPAPTPHVCGRAWLRDWAGQNPRKGFRRAWADIRAEGTVVNKKKVQRLWREEGLRVNVRKVRKRNGESTTPIADADAPNAVWSIDLNRPEFESTSEGRMFKLASMLDEHTRESLLHITERSITAERLVSELEAVMAVK
jgi:putative transposase